MTRPKWDFTDGSIEKTAVGERNSEKRQGKTFGIARLGSNGVAGRAQVAM